MEYEARRFARRILLIHGALLLGLLLVVGTAVWLLYNGARAQAVEQATQKQTLLAKQTALGIANYYESITAVMDLLQPSEEAEAPPRHPPGRRPPRDPGAVDARRRIITRVTGDIGAAAWQIIQDKASQLVLLDPYEDFQVVRVIGSIPDAPDLSEIIAASRPWLSEISRRGVSQFVKLKPGGAHVVAVPLRGQSGLLMVAVVPIRSLENNVLQYVNRSENTSAILVDDEGTFISAPIPGAIGRNITELDDPRTRAIAEHYQSRRLGGTVIFDREEKLGDVTFKPGMSTIEPTEVLGRTWIVVISSTLNSVDGFVRPIFRDAVLWAGFVALAAGGILASTAIQLIRGRVRLERLQREVLAREVAEAREIQLHWLPKGSCRTDLLEISAINKPATHISGDFYNWFELGDGRIAVAIGDVTGHGMAAAFLMATTQLLVRNILPRVEDPSACLTEINRQLCGQTFNGQFVTLLIVVIDPEHNRLEVATAGHPDPLISRGEAFEPLSVEPQLVLGVENDANYTTQRFMLRGDESIVLYTDGVVDVQNPDGRRLGVQGLAGSLRGRFDSADAIIAALTASVDAFRAGRDLADDLTLVAVQIRKVPSGRRTEGQVSART